MALHKKLKAKVTKHFSKLQLSIFAVLFAGIGGYFVINSFAATSQTCDFTYNSSQISAFQATFGNSSASSGKTICLTAGNYGSITLNNSHSDYVIITPVQGDTVTFGTITFGTAASYIHLEKINANNITSGIQPSGNNASFIKIRNGDFTGITASTPGTDWLIEHNRIHDCGGMCVTLNGGSASNVPGTGQPNATNFPKIKNMTLRANKIGPMAGGEDAIRLSNFDNVVIEENEIAGVIEDGQHNDCLQSVWGGKNLYYRRNFTHDTGCQIFFIKDGTVDNIVVDNNLMVRNNLAGTSSQIWNSTNVTVTNNTMWDRADLFIRWEDGFGPAPTNTQVNHNVLDSFVAYPTTRDWPSVMTEDYNVLGDPDSGLPWVRYGTIGSHSVAVAKKADPSNPGFVNKANNDYRLTGQVTKGGATYSAGVSWKPSDYVYGPEQTSTTPPTACTTTLNSGANLSQAMNSVVSGGTVCLNAGAYTWNGSTWATVSKASMTKLIPAPGVAKSAVTVGFMDLGLSKNIRVEGMTIAGFTTGNDSDTATNIQFVDNTFTSSTSTIRTSKNANLAYLVEGNTFASIDAGGGYEGRLSVRGYNNTVANGVKISGNTFGPGGCSDGVQIIGDANGTEITDNIFTGILQGSCAAHSDAIQLYGSKNTKITGNCFTNGDTFIMAPDGSENEYLANNVFNGTGVSYIDKIQFGSANTPTFIHNTVRNARVSFDSKVGNSASNNVTAKDNILIDNSSFKTSNGSGCAPSCTFSSNLFGSNANASGTGNLIGTPVFAGGANPTTFAGFALASGSPGKNAGSDGKDMGISLSGTTPPPTPKPGDTNGDNVVNIVDLSTVLSKWNTNFTAADFNKDNTVNIVDLSILLSNYGK